MNRRTQSSCYNNTRTKLDSGNNKTSKETDKNTDTTDRQGLQCQSEEKGEENESQFIPLFFRGLSQQFSPNDTALLGETSGELLPRVFDPLDSNSQWIIMMKKYWEE